MIGEQQGNDAAREAPLLSMLRQALERLEQDVEGMFALVYQIQAFALASDPDPQTGSVNLMSLRPQIQRAQDHVSQAIDAYHNELLSKRELLYEFVAETYDTDEFCDRWSRLDEVRTIRVCREDARLTHAQLSSGAKLDVDALADLLGGLGGI